MPWRFSDAGLQCVWPVRHDRRPRNLHNRSRAPARLSDTVIGLVSEASVQSKWVNWELRVVIGLLVKRILNRTAKSIAHDAVDGSSTGADSATEVVADEVTTIRRGFR